MLEYTLEFELERKVCEKFCSYYKSSKNIELSCRGLSVVERLREDGKDITLEKSDKVLNVDTEKVLIKYICTTCPYYEKDCDFIQYQGTNPSCGGFILLGQLLESDKITLDDIMRCIQ